MNFNQKLAIVFLIGSLLSFIGAIVLVIAFITDHASTSLYAIILGFLAGVLFVFAAILVNKRGIKCKQE